MRVVSVSFVFLYFSVFLCIFLHLLFFGGEEVCGLSFATECEMMYEVVDWSWSQRAGRGGAGAGVGSGAGAGGGVAKLDGSMMNNDLSCGVVWHFF